MCKRLTGIFLVALGFMVVWANAELIEIGFEDQGLSSSSGTSIRYPYDGVSFPGVRFMSESVNPNYSEPHTGNNYIFPVSYPYIEIDFDPAVYPDARLQYLWVTNAATGAAEEVRLVAYDTDDNVIAQTDYLLVTSEPQQLMAIDMNTGQSFGYAPRIVAEPRVNDGFVKFSIDDINFLDGPSDNPVAVPGGPYQYIPADTLDGAYVTLDGGGSYDSTGVAIVDWRWDLDLAVDSDNNGFTDDDVDMVGEIISAFFPVGITDISLTVINDNGTVSPAVSASVQVNPYAEPGQQIIIDFEDLTPTYFSFVPASYAGLIWKYEGTDRVGLGVEQAAPDYSMPHSGQKYAYNYGNSGSDFIEFGFDPAIYVEGQLLGAWFARASSSLLPENIDTPFEIWLVGYDSQGNPICESDRLELTEEPQYLEAIDATTNSLFSNCVWYVVMTDMDTNTWRYSMDDLAFLTSPAVKPVANPGGPYTFHATSWDGGAVLLDGSASESPIGTPIVSYLWDLNTAYDTDGDGDPANDVDIDSDLVNCEFPLGQTEVSLTVVDQNGLVSETVVTSVTLSIYDVTIDIRPGTDDNVVVLHSCGVVPVAFITDENFDAALIDPATITLSGASFDDGIVKVWGCRKKHVMAHLCDIDGDGDKDLVAFIDIRKLAEHDIEAVCEIGAKTYDGYVVSGYDTIRIIHRKWWWLR